MRRIKPETIRNDELTSNGNSLTSSPDDSEEKYDSEQVQILKVLESFLDMSKKAHFSNDEIYEISWAVGVEVNVETMRKVTDCRNRKLRLEAFASMLTRFLINPEHLEEAVTYYWKTGRQLRPDGFQFLHQAEYIRRRFLRLIFPFTPVAISPFIPHYTALEESIYYATKTLVGYLSTLYSLMCYVCLALSLTGTSQTSALEIAACCLTNIPIAWGAQAAREATLWSEEGMVEASKWQKALFVLRYSKVTLRGNKNITGAQAVKIMLSETRSSDHLAFICQESPQTLYNRRLRKEKNARKRSFVEEVEQVILDDNHALTIEDGIDAHFNIFICGYSRIVPFVLGLLMMLLPTVMPHCKDHNILSSAYGGGNIGSDIFVMIQTLIAIFFVSLGILKHADDELSMLRRWAKFMRLSISLQSGNSVPVNFTLQSVDAVKGFSAFYEFVSSLSLATMHFHTASLAALSVVCVSAVCVIFTASVMEVEIDVWNSYLLLVAIICNYVIFRSLINVAIVDTSLYKGIIFNLKHQITVNDKLVLQDGREVDAQLSASDIAEIQEATKAIKIFIESLEITHKTPKLYGVLPLTKLNLI
eukprot:CAMPEP_0118633062 /NCGR_PEP_ID=MMETSP0785-20121206/788_1 /TAXON_ID=91992 /ORGANISM="Bolidomonas pacifica, Strain CCMP 1866" /LENGTH=588 /DNA_ID=CAMNT_0006523895 /DNA_START=145 /DNA_END=1909 /DNA_ORIENTATION=-